MEGKRIPPPPPLKREAFGEKVPVSSNVEIVNNNVISNKQEQKRNNEIEKNTFHLGDKAKTVLLVMGAVVFLLGAIASFIMLFI